MQRQRVAARMVASSSSNVDEDNLSNISINLTDSELSYCDRFQVGPDELPLEIKVSSKHSFTIISRHFQRMREFSVIYCLTLCLLNRLEVR